MAFNEYAGFKLGAFVSPLTSATTNPLLQDADPALFATISFYQAIPQTHLGARFDAEVSRLGLDSSLLGQFTARALPCDPQPFLQQAQLPPPWLAVFRVDEDAGETGVRNWYHIVSKWQLQFVLPAVDMAQYVGLYGFLRAIVAVLVDRTEQGYDPSYLGGQQVWKVCGMESIGIKKIQYGAIDALKTNLFLPGVVIDIEVKEQKGETPGMLHFGGDDTSIGADGVTDFIDTKTTL